MSNNHPKKLSLWKWPKFSLRSFLIALTFYFCFIVAVGIINREDEAIGTIMGGLVLMWLVICWRTVYLNRSWLNLRDIFSKFRHP